MKRISQLLLATLFAALPLSSFASPEGWTNYEAPEFGYSMLVLEGTQMAEKTWAGGWGGLAGQHEGVVVYGLAKLGAQESAEAIEAYAVTLTGVPASAWTEVNSGEGNGWKWFKTVKAESGNKVVFGDYGVGPKGSYLILTETSPAHFDEYEADFEQWYESIKLH